MFRKLAPIALLCAVAVNAAGAGPVNVNTADAETIARELDGVGLARARAIVEWRRQNGEFASLDDLEKVKGIGSRILEMNRGNIRFADAER